MHSNSRSARSVTRILSGLLSIAIWISSFGPSAAHAAVSITGKVGSGTIQAPATLQIPSLSTPLRDNARSLSIAPGLGSSVLPTPAPAIPTAPKFVTPATAIPATGPVARQAGTIAPSGISAPVEKETVRGQVAKTVRRLDKARGTSAQARVLNTLFLGGLNAADDSEAPVDASGSQHASKHALRRLALSELVSAATNPESTLDSRKAAIRVLAKVEKDGVKEALEKVANAHPEGGAAEYEVHREALRTLDSKFGILKSLRPISESHKNEILSALENEKPEMVLTDYDRTLADTKVVLSPAMAETLASVPNAGVEIAILTDRPAQPRYAGDITIFQSLAAMTPAQKTNLTVLSDIGAKTSVFNKQGSALTLHVDENQWTAEELAALQKASKALRARFKDQDFLGNTEVYEADSYERFLPKSLTDAEIAEAGTLVDAVLKEGGITNSHIVARRPLGGSDVPYVRVSMINKSAAAVRVRENVRFIERARDVIRFGGGIKAIAFAKKIFSRFPARPVSARRTLLLGDSFMPEAVAPGSDALMAKGVPGALALAVGGVASPRLDNVFVWPTLGEAASLEILGAIGKPAASTVDKKAVAGLFAQRTIAITTFILTTIAFTAIAVPVVGWVGYGTIMAVGSLAPIAVGPLNGWIVDKLSARNSMAMNTAARVVLDILPPVLVLLGMINLPMLILASFANFWVLSSVMTTEGAYIKRLAGKKYVGPVNSLLWMNYLIVQVVLALILGFGAIVGIVGPVNAYFIAAAINAFVIMPIVWFTMPNTKPTAKAPGRTPQRPSAKKLFLKGLQRYGVGFAALTASILSYLFVWSSPVPIALVLAYLVLRTDGAKLLWNGDARDIGKRETKLADKIKTLESEENPNAAELKAAKTELNRWKKSPRIAMLYIALGALTLGPLQSFVIPRFTEAVTGLAMSSPESTLLFGQYLGALFFGSLIANAGQVRLPEIHVPIFGRIAGQRFLQGLVAMLAPLWTFTSLIPGNLPAAAAALTAVAVLMTLAAKLTNRAWIKIFGLGMAGIWLPYLAWGSAFLSPAAAMFLTVMLTGMVYGPSFVSLKTIFEGSLQKSTLGKMIGVQGSLLNAARSIAIGGTAAVYGALNPAFPAFLAILGGFYAAIGLAFWLAPRFFPGLPQSLLRKKDV